MKASVFYRVAAVALRRHHDSRQVRLRGLAARLAQLHCHRVAAVASFVIGGGWYSPLLFGRIWMRETGLQDEAPRKRNMGVVFGLHLC